MLARQAVGRSCGQTFRRQSRFGMESVVEVRSNAFAQALHSLACSCECMLAGQAGL